jgi:hypothetical protein
MIPIAAFHSARLKCACSHATVRSFSHSAIRLNDDFRVGKGCWGRHAACPLFERGCTDSGAFSSTSLPRPRWTGHSTNSSTALQAPGRGIRCGVITSRLNSSWSGAEAFRHGHDRNGTSPLRDGLEADTPGMAYRSSRRGRRTTRHGPARSGAPGGARAARARGAPISSLRRRRRAVSSCSSTSFAVRSSTSCWPRHS